MTSFLLVLFLVFITAFVCCTDTFEFEDSTHRRLEGDLLVIEKNITLDSKLTIYYDPPNGHMEPTALAIFVRAYYGGVENEYSQNARIYYDATGAELTLNSSFADYSSPYIELSTAFKAIRYKNISLIAVTDIEGVEVRSAKVQLSYIVEGGARPYSYGFLVPGVESGGYFLGVELETAAAARAQAAGGQEFADFTTDLGIGTYETQIQALKLTTIDEDLKGFEGGFAVNMTYPAKRNITRHYGILIPYHNGEDFFGKVVRVDLMAMKNTSTCIKSYRIETVVNGRLVVTGTPGHIPSEQDACVTVLDLASLHPKARGFRRGFVNNPYGYLSAGEFSVIARLDVRHFRLNVTRVIDLSQISPEYGGYSGGFADGSWACFNPFRTYAGPVGGIRSTLAVDANHLRPYFYSTMLCINSTAWSSPNVATIVAANIVTLDFSSLEEDIRGFSDAIRVGRYAYFTPLNSGQHTFSYKVVRISLGQVDVGTTLKEVYARGASGRTVMEMLDLSKISPNLRGYSGIFSSGKHLFFVPYRNEYEPSNGQRGHGWLTRLDMNDFSLKGITYLDLSVTSRNQIPSFAEVNLRGFSYGFASGSYGLLVPFFNAVFNGKIARFLTQQERMDTNLQELDTVVDRTHPNTYKGFRGGFVSLWQGTDF